MLYAIVFARMTESNALMISLSLRNTKGEYRSTCFLDSALVVANGILIV